MIVQDQRHLSIYRRVDRLFEAQNEIIKSWRTEINVRAIIVSGTGEHVVRDWSKRTWLLAALMHQQ